MVVTTDSPEVVYQAQLNLREFLGTRPLEALAPTAEIEDLVRFVKAGSVVPEQHQQYAVVRNQQLCISCTRCVRACSGLQNLSILSIDPERPAQPICFEGDLPLHMTSCIACGQCCAICPTGAVKERNDVPIVEAELAAQGDARKILILQTAPAARLSVGELMGEELGKTEIGKLLGAVHSLGFDYVFDTSFAADTCATLEAEELVERIRANGPFPMFTSCCPGWVNLVEKKYQHLRPLLSRCKSPMMMLGAMVRSWMQSKSIARDKYFVVSLMPCIAKKEEILRPELMDSHTARRDVDVVLTVREFADLLHAHKVDWAAMPGTHKAEYDEPFGVSSGAGALFAVSGGVTEAAMRVAYTVFTKEIPDDPHRSLYEDCRRIVQTGEWVDTQIDMTPGRRHRRPLESLIIHGGRNIQQFLEDSGLSVSVENYNRKGRKVFIEMMACPGGCIGGGGQPRSIDEHVLEKRRSLVHRIDRETRLISPMASQHDFQVQFLQGITSQHARELLEYDPPILFSPSSRSATRRAPLTGASVSPSGSDSGGKFSHKKRASGGSPTSSTSHTSSDSQQAEDIVILYGSQGGITATFARHLFAHLTRNIRDDISIQSMDRVNFDRLSSTRTIIMLTSTWESEDGLMPQNARRLWAYLRSLPLTAFGNSFSSTKFAVCGFGSSKYLKFCGFAVQLYDALLRLGSHPFADLVKIDVERADKGKKPFL
jgi:NADH-quinone oxidoreductase subunit G